MEIFNNQLYYDNYETQVLGVGKLKKDLMAEVLLFFCVCVKRMAGWLAGNGSNILSCSYLPIDFCRVRL